MDALPPAVLDRLIARWPCARMAIGVPNDSPWTVPIVFAADPTGAIWSAVDGKPKASRRPARLAHVAREGRATLLLDEYAEDWSALWWVRIRATAAVRPVGPAGDAHRGIVALRAKYLQYERVPVVIEPATLIELRVRVATGWAAGGWGAVSARVERRA